MPSQPRARTGNVSLGRTLGRNATQNPGGLISRLRFPVTLRYTQLAERNRRSHRPRLARGAARPPASRQDFKEASDGEAYDLINPILRRASMRPLKSLRESPWRLHALAVAGPTTVGRCSKSQLPRYIDSQLGR